tara:strand:+ start:2839 stop:2997 length:159 start_codon:yes stop_codon:yes gene_type:complete
MQFNSKLARALADYVIAYLGPGIRRTLAKYTNKTNTGFSSAGETNCQTLAIN